MKPMTKQCERARECASLRLDGELSEFEQALLGAHLARCEPCRSFAHELESLTDHMRSTPLARLEQPVSLPARRRLVSRRPVEIAAAAALMLTTLGVAGALRTVETNNPTLSFGAPGVSNTLESREFSDIRREMLRPPSPADFARRPEPPDHLGADRVRLRRVRLAGHVLRLSARPCRQVGGRVRAAPFSGLGAGTLR